MLMAIPPASPAWLCRWRPTVYRVSLARSPACSPALTGLSRTVRIAPTSSVSPPTRRFCLSISSRGLPRGSTRRAPTWPVRLRYDLRRALVDQAIRKVDLWTARHRLTTVPFADHPVDPFFNANRPEDLETAAALLAVAAG